MTKHSIKQVAATPVLLSPQSTHSGVDIIIQNNSAQDLFIGAAGVSVSNYGFKVSTSSAISIRLGGNDEIYGVTNSASISDINILTVGLA